jgi:hypothetical protein
MLEAYLGNKSLLDFTQVPPYITEKVKSNENRCIYNVLNTSDHQFVVSPPKPFNKKTHPRTVTTNNRLKPTKNGKLLENESQEGPQFLQKSVKIQPWTPRSPLWCALGPLDHNTVTQGSKIKPPRCKSRASRRLNALPRVLQTTHSNSLPILQSYRSAVDCSRRGRRQGRSLKIRPQPEGMQGVTELA